jgi:hypothetical protein
MPSIEFSTGQVLAWVVFGLIGMAAFRFGKKEGRPKTMVVAGALMVYPYFVSSALWLWLIGLALSGALFVYKD